MAVAAAGRPAGPIRISALVFLCLVCSSEAYKILVIYPVPSRSHNNLGMGMVRALLKKGHEVTYTSIYPTNKTMKGLTELDFSGQEGTLPEMKMTELLQQKRMEVSFVRKFAIDALTNALENEHLQKIMRDPKQKFDVVIGEWFFTNAIVGLGAALDCPFILVSTMGMHLGMELIFDEVQSPAVQPHFMSGFSVPMTFYERIVNTAAVALHTWSSTFSDTPIDSAIYDKYIKPVGIARGISVPSFQECLDNVAFLFVNSHASLGQTNRLPPNAAEIGGYHIDDNIPPLSEKLQKIMDDAKHGVIYFSMGSVLKTNDFPVELRNALLKVFARLKETVLWKFEADIPDLPSNVHIQSWMPQQSILAHKNTKLFITHGGLLSTTEAIHYGVPLLGIPMFGDQPMNMARAARRGYARHISLFPNGAEALDNELREMLSNPKYAETAKGLSRLYHDRPMKPADTLVYWTEFVIRTGGAQHLRSAARLVPWYQRYLLDILGLLLGIISTVIYLLFKLAKCLFGKKPESKKNKNKNKNKKQ